MDNMKVAYETMLGLAAEMILDEALAQGDPGKFMQLTDELKAIGS